MVLEDYRSSADEALGPWARMLKDVDPMTLTWASFACAVIAGALFILTWIKDWFLLMVPVFVFLNGFFDALDGKVARMSKKSSQRGDFLDHVLDRYADIFILGGIALSPYCPFKIGLLAIIGVMFASYMGTQAQAVGCGRKYKGYLGRADRLVILTFVPIAQYFLVWPDFHIPYVTITIFDGTPFMEPLSLTLLGFVMIGFAIVSHATALQRAYTTWRELKKREIENRIDTATDPGKSFPSSNREQSGKNTTNKNMTALEPEKP